MAVKDNKVSNQKMNIKSAFAGAVAGVALYIMADLVVRAVSPIGKDIDDYLFGNGVITITYPPPGQDVIDGVMGIHVTE